MIKTPFEAGQKTHRTNHQSRKSPGTPTLPGNFWEVWEQGQWTTNTGGASEEAGISKSSDDVWYGNSWHDFGGSDATTTKPGPGAWTKQLAR
jgi:hypothetical protein